MKKGNTLAEVLIALTIIGVVVAVTTPNFLRTMPDEEAESFKRAHSLVSTVFSEIINDRQLFEKPTFYKTKNTGYMCRKFVDSIEVQDATDCESKDDYTGTPNFITKNGMKWWGFNNSFENSYATIWVDIDGDEGTDTLGEDILRMIVCQNGKINIIHQAETEYLYGEEIEANADFSCPTASVSYFLRNELSGDLTPCTDSPTACDITNGDDYTICESASCGSCVSSNPGCCTTMGQWVYCSQKCCADGEWDSTPVDTISGDKWGKSSDSPNCVVKYGERNRCSQYSQTQYADMYNDACCENDGSWDSLDDSACEDTACWIDGVCDVNCDIP